ncbi:MAG: hypothetical protein J3R72DRAFT_497964 [Linnemannia gamsii]|nr:MAG: hypothetical protein J3R72DRAFT_497964 [Linnemannia gamsii]
MAKQTNKTKAQHQESTDWTIGRDTIHAHPNTQSKFQRPQSKDEAKKSDLAKGLCFYCHEPAQQEAVKLQGALNASGDLMRHPEPPVHKNPEPSVPDTPVPEPVIQKSAASKIKNLPTQASEQ